MEMMSGRVRQLVLLEYAKPVTAFKHTKQLITVFHQGLETVRCLHEHTQIVLRDISARNILITGARNGVLVDWDLSENVDVRIPLERTGTWQFMSVRLLQHPTRRLLPKYADALESFWHTLLYIALRHCDHNYSSQEIVFVLEDMMSDCTFKNGKMVGGVQKEDELKTRRHIMKMDIRSPPLRYILRKSAKILAARYNHDTHAITDTMEPWKQMESAFDDILKDPTSAWDRGKENVQ